MTIAAVREGGGHEQLPFAGQSVGLIEAVESAADIVARLMRETSDALAPAVRLGSPFSEAAGDVGDTDTG
jgi:hypothetical protein